MTREEFGVGVGEILRRADQQSLRALADSS
jgi:hypothetical protein